MSTIIRTIELPSMTVTLHSNEIVHVKYLQDQVIDVAEKKQEHQANLDITDGKKMPFLISFESYVTITKEAKEYSIKIEAEQPFLAVAIIVDNLAYQLMADFYFKFYKPKIAYKVFKSEPKAVEWLVNYRKDLESGKDPSKSKKLPFFNF